MHDTDLKFWYDNFMIRGYISCSIHHIPISNIAWDISDQTALWSGRAAPFFYGSIGFRGSKQTFVLLYSICLKCTVFEICNRSTSTITCTGALSPCEARLALRARLASLATSKGVCVYFQYSHMMRAKHLAYLSRLLILKSRQSDW